MRKFIQLLLLVAIVAGTMAQPFAAITVAAPLPQRPTSLVVSLVSDPIEIVESTQNGETFTSFNATAPLEGEAGAPALPIVSEVVGIPANTAPMVTFALAEAKPLGTAAHPIQPMPSYSVVSDNSGEFGSEYLEGSYQRNDSLYRTNSWHPAEPVRVSEPFTLRGQAMVRVEYSPIQVNPATGEIRFISAANVTLAWDSSALTEATEVRNDPLWEDVFAATLSNYEEARTWRAARTPIAERNTAAGTDRWLIRIKGEGLYKLPLSQLSGAGVSFSQQGQIALYKAWDYTTQSGTEEQAMWYDAATSTLYFVNTRDHGYWSDELTYHLVVLPTATAARMVEEPSAPTAATDVTRVPYTLRFEEEHDYNSEDTLTQPGEKWFWERMAPIFAGIPVMTATTTFDLPAQVPNTGGSVFAEISPDAAAYASICYIAKVTVNGVAKQDQWTGYQAFNEIVTLNPGQLNATNNSFMVNGIHCPGNTTGNAAELLFNAFDVTYERYLTAQNNVLRFNGLPSPQDYRVSGFGSNDIVAFEISQLNAPTHLAGTAVDGTAITFNSDEATAQEFLVSTKGAAQPIESIARYVDRGLRTNLAQTDWILVTHPDFINAVQPLAAHRQSEGLTTRVVSVTDIYNDFGDGSPDPETIREFLKYAHQNWNAPAPSYVFLMGDGTYDPLDYQGTGSQTWVPPIFRDVDQYLGEAPADNAFVNGLDVGDNPNDPTPDMHIGRLTPNSAAEVSALVSKIITYDNDPSQMNDWRRTILLTTDNPDRAGNFHQLSERIFGDGGGPVLVPNDVKPIRAYLQWDPDGGGPLPQPYPLGSASKLRDTIINTINRGALLVQYIGHAAPDQWAGEGLISLRTNGGRDDVGRLRATDRYAFALPWTCWEGYFVHADPDNWSLSEVMTRQSDRGFIGSFAPTGLDVAEGHDKMTAAFYRALFGTTGEPTTANFGELTERAKLAVIGTSVSRLAFTYMLYGDPASELPVPECLLNGTNGDCAVDGVQFLPNTYNASH